MTKICPKRGDIYYVDFGDKDGSVQKGIRPALIIQNDVGNQHSNTTQVIPMTSKLKSLHLPTHVIIRKTETGLKCDSMLEAEQLTTISQDQLLKKISKIAINDEIRSAVIASLAI